MESTGLYHRRLLHDIHEISTKPYPNIIFHSYEDDINQACLILTPPGLKQIHLTVDFGNSYPLEPPKISIQTRFDHPNVHGHWICASILTQDEGYTPAYTLKGIAIQMLSFFSSDKLEQDHGGKAVDLAAYRDAVSIRRRTTESYSCSKCCFPDITLSAAPKSATLNSISPPAKVPSTNNRLAAGLRKLHLEPKGPPGKPPLPVRKTINNAPTASTETNSPFASVPPEILIRICNFLEGEDLIVFMQAWDRVGGADGVVTQYDLIRTRELQCFALKEGFGKANLGVGVHIASRGRYGSLESEFDFLSDKAFTEFCIRKSVQGIRFERWLPLPISRPHYQRVKDQVEPALRQLGTAARLSSVSSVQVLYAFMNDVVVKLSTQASTSQSHDGYYTLPESTLKHASEKAIESYYHLFHLLLCIAAEDKTVVPTVNQTLGRFLQGHNGKDAVPNLGHLLIMVLISDFDMDEKLTMAIIKEAVTRNVVWMLDSKGAGMAELSYMENDKISEYRLKKTFEASKTSYRLLMFFNLFRNTVNRGSGTNRKSVQQLRDVVFDAHGAPPRGASTTLARNIKGLEQITDFPNFLRIMGVKMPQASYFTTFLRDCCQASVAKGYSVWAYSQTQALNLRQRSTKEPNVGVRAASEQKPEWRRSATARGTSFFPNTKGGGGRR